MGGGGEVKVIKDITAVWVTIITIGVLSEGYHYGGIK